MAIVAEELVADLIVRSGKLRTEMNSTAGFYDQKINQMDRSTKRLATDVVASNNRIAGSFRGLGTALGAVSIVALASGLLKLADAAKNIDAQLRLATAGFGTFGQATEDVRRISEQTRAGLEETSQLYANFARNGKDLGLTQAQVAQATTSVAQAFKISGASSVEAAQGTRQLVQGLQSGVLRGDEFNTVMEAAPRLAKLLADSLGVPIGALRKMAEEGKLTSAALSAALTDTEFTKGLDAEFKKLPVTFDQAMQRVYDSAIVTFGAFDRGGEFSSAIANFIVDGSAGFADLEKAAENFGIGVRGTLEGLGSAFSPFVDAGIAAFETLGISLSNFSADGRKEISGLLGALDQFDKWAGFSNGINVFGTQIGGNAQGRFDAAGRASDARLQGNARDRMANDRFGFGPGGLQGFVQNGYGTGAGLTGGGRRTPTATGASGRKRAGRTAASPLDPEAFAREEAALNAEILGEKQDELAEAQARTAEAIRQINADKKYTDVQKERLVALTGTLGAVQEAAIAAKRAAKAEEDAADARVSDLENQRDVMRSADGMVDTRQKRLDQELELIRIGYAIEREKLNELALSKDVAEATRARARLALLPTLQQNEEAGVRRDNESPLARYRRDIAEMGNNYNDEFERIQVDGLESLNDGITDTISNVIKLGGVFGSVVDQIVADLIRVAVQQAIIKPLTNALGGLFGGGGAGAISNLGGNSFSVSGGAYTPGRASGGPVSGGKMYRVNEAGGPEYFQPSGDGRIIPLGQVAQSASATESGSPTIIVNIPQNNNFAGGAATQEDVVRMASLTRESAIQGTIEALGRRSR